MNDDDRIWQQPINSDDEDICNECGADWEIGEDCHDDCPDYDYDQY